MELNIKQITHAYPKQVHILDHPYLTQLTALASSEQTRQPRFNLLIKEIYRELFIQIVNNEWPLEAKSLKTRMTATHPEQRLEAQFLKKDQKAVTIDVVRAGMLPSQIFFDRLNTIANPEGIRQDHVFASRIMNSEDQVTHTELNSAKIGGDVDGAIVMIPDPMGATGNSICEVVQHYKEKVKGRALKYVTAHMIITPEFVKKVTTEHPDVLIYAIRLDRGLSSPEALKKAPGELWDQEKGLNDSQYIVPGAGGVGELINNSFV